MPAFQFPDPIESGITTVTNPVTGSTYQWKEPPGKWVVTVKMREFGDIIWEGDNPPSPIGDYKLWYSTDTLELYFYYCDVNDVCAWIPTSTPITQIDLLQQQIDEIKDNIGQATLEDVLTNGNISDKSIVLTNASDDALLLSPEEARIMIAGAGDSVVPKIELRHTTGVLDTSLVALELDEDGKRFDIECDERVDNIHFRFGNDDKLILNKQGDAVFGGKVEVEPGAADNEVVTYTQLREVEQEISSLLPSIERGKFEITTTPIDTGTAFYGKFNMFRKFTSSDKTAGERACDDAYDTCVRVPDNDQIFCENERTACKNAVPAVGSLTTTQEFKFVEQLKFSIKDINGDDHGWSTVAAGQYLEIINQTDDSYLLAEVTATQGMWYELITITVNPIKSRGSATGVCAVKVFELDLSQGSELDFVRKQGSNTVQSGWKIESDTRTHFHVDGTESRIYWLKDPEHDQQPVTRGYANTNYALKQYVDDAIATLSEPAPARYAWTVQIGDASGEPDDGKILIPNGTVSSRNVIKLSQTPTVGAQFYQRTNKMIFEGKFVNNNTERVNPQIFTVWDRSNGKWRWKATCNIHYMQYDAAGNILIDVGDQVHWNKVDEGNTLYINIAGFL